MKETSKKNETILSDDKLLTIRQCHEATGFHKSYFGNLIRDKQLKAKKGENGYWLVRQSDLDRFLQSKTVKPRRDPVYTAVEKPNSPQTSLLTQVQEKDAQILDLQERLKDALLDIDEAREDSDALVSELKTASADLTRRYEERGRKIEQLESDLEKYEEEIQEHNSYLRSTLDSVLQYLMK